MAEPVHAHLIANARYHDTDYARLELLKLLSDLPHVRTTVASSFGEADALDRADFLITYTCDLRPNPHDEIRLREFVESGGRWIALHGTNALLDFGPKGVKRADGYDTFMQTLGSRFIAHPLAEPYQVTASDPGHELVAGIEAFETTDELYLCEYYGNIQPLLETRFVGTFQSGYVDNEWLVDEPRLVAYLHPVGQGEVFYCTLGHCCGVHDMRPIRETTEVVRGSWENPVFIELLRRAITWATAAIRDRPEPT